MTIKIFPEFLHKIALKKYPNKDQNESLLSLFDNNIYPLYTILYSSTNIGLIDRFIKEEISFPIFIITNLKQRELMDLH